MSAVAAWLFIAVVATDAWASAAPPDDTVRAFYAWVLSHPSRALPSRKERAELANVLAPELMRLLNAAAEVEAKCVKAAPKGEKPLILEGDLFVGNYEGATEVAYRETRPVGDLVAVDADLIYVDRRFPKAHKHRAVAWKDRIELRRVGGRWYVDDVRFADNRSLKADLSAYLDEGTRSCGG